MLDFDRPIAVLMLGILGKIPSYDDACSVVARFVEAVPSGSFVVINDGTDSSDEITKGASAGAQNYALRRPEQIAHYFEGLELEEPGVVPTTRWRHEPEGDPLDGYCAVARKP